MKELFSKFKYFYGTLDKEQSKITLSGIILKKIVKTIYWRIRNKIVEKQYNNEPTTFDIMQFHNEQLVDELEIPSEIYHQKIDVIIPVYNGFEYLNGLFNSIEKTRMPYRLIIINDCSSDERVYPYLKEYNSKNENVILLQNDKNLGFVKSVNKALKIIENHVAIVNTDVEVPEFWLERLMIPIIYDKNIASTTPFTNCGTICSFPNFCKDNALLEGFSLQDIDNEFQKIKPKYYNIPTGVGFCMGMSQHVIKKIGMFDEIYNKGYCEENDWCQRANKSGYKNVQIENLFVYHKHGGSFLSEDKIRYQQENQKVLNKRYPSYLKDVALYCETDPARSIRDYVLLQLLFSKESKPAIMAFDHWLGGGATSYLEKQRVLEVQNGERYIIFRYNWHNNNYVIICYYQDYTIVFHFSYFEDIQIVLEHVNIGHIYINEFVTYPKMYDVFNWIVELKKSHAAKMTMLLHDYFCMCPIIYLLNEEKQFCNLPTLERCEKCVANSDRNMYLGYGTVKQYRENWERFLNECDEIRGFSMASIELFKKVYGEKESLTLVPHIVHNLIQINKKNKITKTLNIGLLGVLSVHKGSEIVKGILIEIEKYQLDVRIILLGESEKGLENKYYRETGHYNREMLPKLVLEEDIDIFLIPSIWPETFSYTTEEIMLMNMPIAVFDMGAPAERVRKYDKGLIIEKTEASYALEQIMEFAKSLTIDCSNYNKTKYLFVAEYISFSSRYRVEHTREQLLLEGIGSDFVELKDIDSISINKYNTVIIYRCTKYKMVEKMIKKAHDYSIKVYYDIDDFVFNYNEIKDLDFLVNEKGVQFKTYSEEIYDTMKLCDGYITSTETLANEIRKSFPNKEVSVNRNRPSMEMKLLSEKARKEVKKDENKVILGYFSGSKTHDGDFEIISDIILEILKENDNVYLMTVGAIELNKKFETVKNKLIHHDFVNWKQLPELIASIDINLMPLEDTLFHRCKSENKWMEALLVGVPTIATFNEELAMVMCDKESAYLCKSKKDWYENLNFLISEKSIGFSFIIQEENI